MELSRLDQVRSSPFFNIFSTIHLQPFTPEDVHSFVESYLNDTEVTFTESEVDHVTHQVGRYPFYLQMASYFLFEAYHSDLSEAHRLELVDWNFLAEAHPHLEGYWQNCTEGQKTVLTLLALLDEEDSTTLASWPMAELEQWFKGVSIPLDDLERRGLATRLGNQYSLISKAFAR